MGLIEVTDRVKINEEAISNPNPSVYFVGEPLDERGELVHSELCKSDIHMIYKVSFDVNEYRMTINGIDYSARNINSKLLELLSESIGKPIVMDSTTLGFVELLYIIRWFSSSQIEAIDVLYLEPGEYKSRANYMSDFGRHEFDLSSHSGGFKGLPGFSQMVSADQKACLISVLGFERSRLGQLMQVDEGAYIDVVLPIFATPSFKAGWDKHSFYQNVETLDGRAMKPEFVSADSPSDIVRMLNRIKNSMDDSVLMVSPFGAKPLSVGVAIFLVNNLNSVILKYDHPTKKRGRSNGVGHIHSYRLKKTS